MGVRNWPWFCGMQTYLKTVICLVAVIILLQGFHMIVLMRIQETVLTAQSTSTWSVTVDPLRNSIQETMKQVTLASVMDTSGMYIILPNLVKPSEDSSLNQSKVTICTQTTSNHLHYLSELSATWKGQISVTVFTHGVQAASAIYAITLLHYCSDTIRRNVRFHLAFPISQPPLRLKSVLKKNFRCDKHLDFQQSSSGKNYESSDLPYPHNILRNIAIQYADSPYILMIDIDFMPSADLNYQFQNFLHRHAQSLELDKPTSENQPKAFVIPSFESKLADFTALTKQDLIREWEQQNIRPFYYKSCWKCNKVTDFDRWKGLPNVDFMEVGYYIDWEDPWEPFYIAKKTDLPLYDGRFKQYGFNRISQVCEMHIAGFKFAVMNNGFIVHHGYKEAEEFHSKKQEENLKNVELFRTFKQELKDRYADSKLEC